MPLGPQNFYNKLDHHHEEAKEWVIVNWNLGNMCNFKCTYCPDILHDGSFGWNDFDTVKTFINLVDKNYNTKKIYFEFTGGEVTLWKDFIKCAEYIKKKGHDVGIITNGSRTIRWWEENKNILDHVCVSYHPEFSKSDHYLQVLDIMRRECRTHSNIMMHYDLKLWDKCCEVVEKVIEIPNISLALQPLIIDFGENLYSYTEEQIQYIDKQWHDFGSKIKHDDTLIKKIYRGSMDMIDTINNLKQNSSAHRFINDKTNNWKGWKCWAGLEQIVVDFDGTIYRGWCHVGGKLGNIKKSDSIIWPKSHVICNKEFCHCNFDIMCKKELPTNRYRVIGESE